LKEKPLYNKTVLRNGLRIVTEKIPHVRSIAIGVWVDVGSRDETRYENGISHFIEHMVFKGTKSRSPLEIAHSLESLGGSLNAFTSREQTCYHAVILDEHLEQAVDILSDILTNATLSPANIKRERQVVIEEIHEIDETPSDRIHELFSDAFWRGQPLGWPIMGTEHTVGLIDRKRITGFMKNNYKSGRIVVAATGNISHKKLVSQIKEKLDFPVGEDGQGPSAELSDEFMMKVYTNKSNQTHLCIGFPGVNYPDPRKYAVLALHYYLGGGMSSALFQKIREDKGLAYTVYTFPDFYRDRGVFGAYMATDRRVLKTAIETMFKEFRKLKMRRLSKDKLDKIKDQFKGHLILGMESTNGRMNRLARQELMLKEYLSPEETIKQLNRLTADDILEAARQIFKSDGMTVTTLGSANRDDLKETDWSII